ncbi:MAG: hypothetical protein V3T31_06660, partial [candidate division Zixibacteria bacterium]
LVTIAPHDVTVWADVDGVSLAVQFVLRTPTTTRFHFLVVVGFWLDRCRWTRRPEVAKLIVFHAM